LLGAIASAVLYKRSKNKASDLDDLSKVWEQVVRDVAARGGHEEADLTVLTGEQFYSTVSVGTEAQKLESIFPHGMMLFLNDLLRHLSGLLHRASGD
jgi:hypothetical protein